MKKQQITLGDTKPDKVQGDGHPIRWRFWTQDDKWHVAISCDPAVAPEDLPEYPQLEQGYREWGALTSEQVGTTLPAEFGQRMAQEAADRYTEYLTLGGIEASPTEGLRP